MTTARTAHVAALPSLALCYTRVSSDDQEREGVSLPAQISTTRRYAAERGLIVHREFQDVLSGTKDARPGYQTLLTEVRRLRAAGRTVVVVVARLDRFGRRVLERVRSREEFKQLGVATHSVREGGEVSDVMANVMAALAEEEIRVLGERVSDAVQHTRSRGWPAAAAAPWGYRRRPSTPDERVLGAFQSTLEVAPAEAPSVVEAFERAARGESLHSLSRWVASLPEQACGGREIAYSNLRLALHSPMYIARQPLPARQRSRTTLVTAAEILATPVGQWPALVSERLWERTQVAIEQHRRVPKQARGAYALTGLLRCPECGGRLHGATLRNKGKVRPDGSRPVYATRRYVCDAAKGAGDQEARSCRFACHADSLERSAIGQVAEVVTRFAGRQGRALLEQGYAARRGAAGGQEAAAVARARQLAAIDVRQEKARALMVAATEKYVQDKLSEEAYQALVAKQERDITAAEAGRRQLLAEEAPGVAEAPVAPLEELLAVLPSWHAALATAQAAGTGAADGDRVADAEKARRLLRAPLVALIDRIIPRRTGYKHVVAAIEWTPQGQRLRSLAA